MTAPITIITTGAIPVAGASAATATSFTFRAASGCKGVTNGQVVPLTFTGPAGVTTLTVNATMALANNGSALAFSPSTMAFTCTRSGSTSTLVNTTASTSLTSPASFGTPFTVDTTLAPLPVFLVATWSTALTANAGTATTSPNVLTITPNLCNNLPAGVTTYPLHLVNLPATDKLLNIKFTVGTDSKLSASLVALAWTTGGTSIDSPPANVNSTITSTATIGVPYTVNAASVPAWAKVEKTGATAPGPGTSTLGIRATTAAEMLSPGTYTATVLLNVTGALDVQIPVTLQVKGSGAALTFDNASPAPTWTISTPAPVVVINVRSSGTPVAYTIVESGDTATSTVLAPKVATKQGLAYSFGSAVSVTFLQSDLDQLVPGTNAVGTVVFNWLAADGTASTRTVTITMTVLAPQPKLLRSPPQSCRWLP